MARESTRSIDRLTAVLAPPVPKSPGPTFPGADERGVGPPGVGWSPPGPPVGAGWAPPGGAESETPPRGWWAEELFGSEEPTGAARPAHPSGRQDDRPGSDPARPGPPEGEEWGARQPGGSPPAARWANPLLGSGRSGSARPTVPGPASVRGAAPIAGLP